MPIDIKEYKKIKERKVKDDSVLLDFMEMEKWYTTNDIQKFLNINHTATLQRLKKLSKRGYIELGVHKIYRWKKIKSLEEVEIMDGYKFL